MTTFTQRYQAGNHQTVWSQLFRYGQHIRTAPLLADAQMVVQITMTRIQYNLDRLIARLDTIGYQFANPPRVWLSPPPDTHHYLDEIEHIAGLMPLAVRGWYEMVGAIDLRGKHPMWPEFSGESYQDPLVVEPIEEQAQFLRFQQQNNNRYVLCISSDDVSKAGYSGGASYDIELPNPGIDGILLNTPVPSLTFIEYVRLCFQAGGFSGFTQFPAALQPIQHLTYLTDGLLPI